MRQKKRYGGRAIDESIVGQMGPAVLAVNTYVRKVKRKTGGGTAKLSWNGIKKESHDNWSEEVFIISAVFPGRGWTMTTYQISTLAGAQKLGKWDRAQLLPIFNQTPMDVADDSDDDEDGDDDRDDDDDQHQQAQAAPDPVLPRPRVAADQHRYEEGDALQFGAEWTHEPQIPGPRRSREGVVTDAYQANVAGQANVLAYTTRFQLVNGRTTSRNYEARPLPRNDPNHDPDEAVDTNRHVQVPSLVRPPSQILSSICFFLVS